MGFYFATYLCTGQFDNPENPEILSEFRFPSIDQMIEKHEWTQGYVSFAELNSLQSLKTIGIKLYPMQGVDLFMKEVSTCTLEGLDNRIRFIPVVKNYTFSLPVVSEDVAKSSK